MRRDNAATARIEGGHNGRKPLATKHRPQWIGRRRLVWRETVIKSYRREAPGQMAVLDAFQARRWPGRMDVNHLIPPRTNGKRWVSNTVKNLNRGLTGIRFHADGGNHSVGWTAV